MTNKFKSYPYALFEGKIVRVEEANVSIMTNALHYGTGAFSGIKAFKTDEAVLIFRLDDHLRRLQNSVKLLRFYYDFNFDEVKQSMIDLTKRNKLESTTYIRPLIYRSDLNLSPDIKGEYSLAVYMLNMENYFDVKKGLKAKISPFIRNSNLSIPSKSKATGGYINSAMAVDDAHESDFDTAIMLDKDGFISEGAVMNLFMVKEDMLVTPGLSNDILDGITRKTIIMLADELKIKIIERNITREELYKADEVFFSGSATDINWCKQVDKYSISDVRGPITEKLASAYRNLSKTHPDLFTPII